MPTPVLQRPRVMASVIVVKNGSALQTALEANGELDLSELDFWQFHQEQVEQDNASPEDLDQLWAQIASANLHHEARTAAGFSFSGARGDIPPLFLQDQFDIDSPYSVEGFLTRGGLSYRLEINTRAIPVSALTRRQMLWGLSAVATGCMCQDPTVQTSSERPSPTGTPPPTTPPAPNPCDLTQFHGPLGPAEPSTLMELADWLDIGGAPTTGKGVVVAVVDSGYNGDSSQVVRDAVADLNPATDERGHGTAVIAHLLAIAPGIRVRSVKYVDNSGYRNYPVAAFQRAVSLEPDIILCSWVMADFSLALQREIANAQAQGILVVFAAGNGIMRDFPASQGIPTFERTGNTVREVRRTLSRRRVHAVAHPDAMTVGGLVKYVSEPTPIPQASVSTSYQSRLYSNALQPQWPNRPVPDVASLVAPIPVAPLVGPALTLTPTSLASTMSRKPDCTPPDDQEVRTSGSSMAAAHAAGIAALVKEAYPAVEGRGLRNAVMSGAQGPRTPEGGFGMIQWEGALDWLEAASGVTGPFFRADLDDDGSGTRSGAQLEALRCPDLVVWPPGIIDYVASRFGIATKGEAVAESHRTAGIHKVYARLSNRSAAEWNGSVTLYRLFNGTTLPYRSEMVVSRAETIAPGDFRVLDALFFDITDVVGVAVVLHELPEDSLLALEGEFEGTALLTEWENNPKMAIRWLEAP